MGGDTLASLPGRSGAVRGVLDGMRGGRLEIGRGGQMDGEGSGAGRSSGTSRLGIVGYLYAGTLERPILADVDVGGEWSILNRVSFIIRCSSSSSSTSMSLLSAARPSRRRIAALLTASRRLISLCAIRTIASALSVATSGSTWLWASSGVVRSATAASVIGCSS